MPARLDQRDIDFADRFGALVGRRREETADVVESVRGIVAEVREKGDAALRALTLRFDELDLEAAGLRVENDEIRRARAEVPAETLDALSFAAERIEAFHKAQLPEAIERRDNLGVRQAMRWRPIDAVGLYVPGGRAAYPSSVLMNAIPARVAGCRRLVMTVPMPEGVVSPLVLAAAEIAGVDEIYRIGGAQAVAALAFGTETIAPVDKVVGPGNAYVAEAKRQLFGRIGIDMIAGPSEVVVVADRHQRADWIALDLLAQAEHDPRAQAILVTDDVVLADAVEAEVGRALATLERSEIAGLSWREEGAVIVIASLEEAPALVDRLAPEHLQLMLEPDAAAAMAERVRHAGAIFLGAFTPEAVGDYVGGPNHVLPTGRSARFASGLAVHDFMKRTTILGCDVSSFHGLADAGSRLARAEGLEAHALSLERRLEEADEAAPGAGDSRGGEDQM